MLHYIDSTSWKKKSPWPRAAVLIGAVLCIAGLSQTSAAAEPFEATHGIDAAAYQTWFDQVVARGLTPAYVSAFSGGEKTLFAAVAIKRDKSVEYFARHGLSATDYRKVEREGKEKGYHPVSLCGYREGSEARFACIYWKEAKAAAWTADIDLAPADYAAQTKAAALRGEHPHLLSTYGDGMGGYRVAVVFQPDEGRRWSAEHDLTAAAFQKSFDQHAAKGFCLNTAAVCPSSGGSRFAAVYVEDARPFTARYGLSASAYQQEFDRRTKEGLRPVCIVGYAETTAPAGKAGDLSAFDKAMKQFMEKRSIPAGTLAVSRGGKLLLQKAYGFRDQARTKPVEPGDPFRLASIGKPITAAAVYKLAGEGKLKLDQPVFAYLDLKPLPGQTPDPRIARITVQNLLDHRGGWDRDAAFDPMFRTLEIATAAGKPGPAASTDVIRYMLGQPLQFDPGAKSVYSNFGYCVLGRAIEKASGKSYVTYLRDEILSPLHITTIELGRTLPELRNAHEPVYRDPGRGPSVVQPERKELVSSPDGGFYLEAMDSHGGLIGSAPDLCRFLDAYWISGQPRRGGSQNWNFFGSLPGTWTLIEQRPSGMNYAALFNQRTDPSGADYHEIQPLLRAAADGYAGDQPLQYLVIFARP